VNSLSGRSAFLALALTAGGCNLVFDLDGFPYAGSNPEDVSVPDVATDMDTDFAPADMGEEPDSPIDIPDDGPDLPAELPRLMITEIMINTSPLGSSGELGEYIEVKNVGSSPIDPRRVSFILHNDLGRSNSISIPPPVTPEQLEMYNALNFIAPGGYFVFIRFAIPELPIESIVGAGNYFDFGTFGTASSIGNSGSRSAELQYFDGDGFVSMDTVRWAGNALRPSDPEVDTPSLTVVEDVSFGVRPAFEHPDLNNTPDNWCLETRPASGPDSFIGSPGGPARCD